MPIRNWNTRRFKGELRQRLEANGQVVGEFVRSDARRRLAGIRDPEWGAQYRSYVAGLVTYAITSQPNEVTIGVGVRGGYSQWHGFYIAMGSRRRAAHPWLRPAVFGNGREIVRLLIG